MPRASLKSMNAFSPKCAKSDHCKHQMLTSNSSIHCNQFCQSVSKIVATGVVVSEPDIDDAQVMFQYLSVMIQHK